MSKFKTIELWEYFFGDKTEVYDYSGKLMKKSACGNPDSRYFPTIDHIRPLSKGGVDVLDNIVICHGDTNMEKDDSFPHWKVFGKSYHAERIKGSRVAYKIVAE